MGPNLPQEGVAMEHKMMVARNLRAGLSKIKEAYTQAFYAQSPFREQWQLFMVKETYDIDWHPHRDIIDRDFAWKSQQLLRRIRGD